MGCNFLGFWDDELNLKFLQGEANRNFLQKSSWWWPFAGLIDPVGRHQGPYITTPDIEPLVCAREVCAGYYDLLSTLKARTFVEFQLIIMLEIFQTEVD